jgi:hypothetical protein
MRTNLTNKFSVKVQMKLLQAAWDIRLPCRSLWAERLGEISRLRKCQGRFADILRR